MIKLKSQPSTPTSNNQQQKVLGNSAKQSKRKSEQMLHDTS